MVISKKQKQNKTPKCNIRLKDSILQQVKKFKYLDPTRLAMEDQPMKSRSE